MAFKKEELQTRFWASASIVVTIGLLLYFSYYFSVAIIMTVVFSGLILLAQWEFHHMAAQKGLHEQSLIYLASPLFVGSVFMASFNSSWAPVPLIVLGSFVFLLLMQHFIYNQEPITRISISLMGLLYVVVPLSFPIKITFMSYVEGPSGQWWVMFLILVTKASDIGAYFFGKSIGKHYLAPKISPKKTYEGLIGGILFSVIACFAIIYLTPSALKILNYPWLYAIVLGIALSVIGLLGDLAESIIKRDAGVKDSNKLKGFGGLLDLFDSLIFTSPAFYLFLMFGKFV